MLGTVIFGTTSFAAYDGNISAVQKWSIQCISEELWEAKSEAHMPWGNKETTSTKWVDAERSIIHLSRCNK